MLVGHGESTSMSDFNYGIAFTLGFRSAREILFNMLLTYDSTTADLIKPSLLLSIKR